MPASPRPNPRIAEPAFNKQARSEQALHDPDRRSRVAGVPAQSRTGSHPACVACRRSVAGARPVSLLLIPLVLLAWALSLPAAGAQELTADRLFPPAVTVGDERTVTVEGKFPRWPVQIECDRADVSVTASETSGSLLVRTAADAPPGIAWLRLHDEASASGLLPLLIETTAVTAEVEPNDRLDQAQRVDLPAVMVGKLEKAGDVDGYVVSVTAGQRLVVRATANRLLGSPMDAVLQVVDRDGNVLAQSDDARGIDPQLAYACRADADLIIRLFAFPLVPTGTIGFAGGADFVYRLQATVGPLLDYALPLTDPTTGPDPVAAVVDAETDPAQDESVTAESDTVEAVVDAAVAQAPATTSPRLIGWNWDDTAEPRLLAATSVSPPSVFAEAAIGWFPFAMPAPRGIRQFGDADGAEPVGISDLPAVISGQFEQPTAVHRVRFTAQPGVKYRARVYSRGAGLLVDSVLTVVDPATGTQLAKNDDASRNERDAATDFTLPGGNQEPTELEVQVTDLVGGHGPGHAYSLWLEAVTPAIELGVAAERFRVVSGKELEIPVDVRRLDGFAQPLRVVVEGLPDGVTAAAMVSEASGDSSKKVTLILVAAAAGEGEPLRFQGPLRIVAYPTEVAEAAPAAAPETATEPDSIVTAEPVVKPLASARFEIRDGFGTADLWLTVAAP